MNTFHTKKIIGAFLVFALVAPGAFLAAPQRAHAQWAVVEVGANLVENTYDVIKNTITAAATILSSVANIAMEINQYVLQPLAFVLSGEILKAMTSSIIKFINGETNKTGMPQFVQNLRGYMMGTGSTQALAFSSQFGRYSNSPYAAHIATSLRDNYLKNSTTQGFFARNTNTLAKYSSDPKAFINGDFGKGGWNEWLSLTTDCQNDPYCLQYRAQRQLSGLVQTKTTAALNELKWGNGFLSWCGGSVSSPASATNGSGPLVSKGNTSSSGALNAGAGINTGVNTKGNGSGPPLVSNGNTSPTTASGQKIGTASGDACTKKDGSPGTILTPGSVIKDELQSVTKANIFKNTHMGNLGPEVSSIMGSMGKIMSTVSLATSILGVGGSGGPAGLSGISQSSTGGGSSTLDQYASPTKGYLGATYAGVIKSSSSFSATPKAVLGRIAEYKASWNTINSAANSASTVLGRIGAVCTQNPINTFWQNATNAAVQASANTALTNEVYPVLSQVATASSTITTARAQVKKVQTEAKASTKSTTSTYAHDTYALTTISPTSADVARAQQETLSSNYVGASTPGSAGVSSGAVASPRGSLTVSGGSIVERMNLITQNAGRMLSTCAP